MRAQVPVTIDRKLGLTAHYIGWPSKQRIELGAGMVNLLSKEELRAIVCHEIGHRELYHTERSFFLVIVAYALAAHLALWHWWAAPVAWVLVVAAGDALRLTLHEVEADLYAMKHAGVTAYHSACTKLVNAGGRLDRLPWRFSPAKAFEYWFNRKRIAFIAWLARE